MLEKLQSKKSVLENFNPFLTGSTNNINVLNNQTVDYESINFNVCDVPSWIGDEGGKDDNNNWIPGSGYSLGAFYINGKPLTSWGAMFGGTSNIDKKDVMRTYYNITAYIKSKYPNGFSAFIKDNKDKIEIYEVTKLKIMEMIPSTSGIGFNIHLVFNIDDKEIWGKFINVGIDREPKFICEDIQDMSIENKLRITGKVWNILLNWFKVKPGIYQCVAKKIFVFNELGQIKELVENNIIEVLHSDDERIKIKYEDKILLIKNPLYFWFNWYFIKK